MADSITAGGFIFPPTMDNVGALPPLSLTAYAIPAVAGNGIAYIGRMFIADRSASKLLSSGGGSIDWKTGTLSMTATTAVTVIGIQDVDAVNGPPGRPDGTYDVSRTVTGSSAIFGSNTWVNTTMASGGKTLSHGEMYAFVAQVAVAGGVFRVAAPVLAGVDLTAASYGVSISVTVLSATAIRAVPDVLFHCDDGTLAWLVGSLPISSVSSVSISSGGANTEYGMRFVLPWTAEVDALGTRMTAGGGSAADHSIILYADPKGTPVTITSIPVLGNQLASATLALNNWVNLQTPVTLTASTTYLLAMRGDGAVFTIQNMKFGDAGDKISIPAGGSLAAGARGSGAGAFSMVETEIPAGFGVRINQISAGSASTVTATTTITITTTITTTVAAGGSVLVHPGMTGGIRG